MPKLQKIHLSKGYAILLIALALATIGLKVMQYHWPRAVLELKGERVEVLVAGTPVHWYKGLGGRDRLKNADAMLFVFPYEDRHGFVMRDMRFPIDIIWFQDGRVVDIAPNVPLDPEVEQDLHVYLPRNVANAALEIPAGWAVAHDLRIGDRLEVISD
ncbi:MAG: hypothetical protein COU35_04900 [Candidatus Magasanikbacteria bacterium CG10_big_fil_rev_8_21_14_0_10_47_10]|uniref:DUF192 domain-containing protein n=1 Tax=Candidatus Magasanikbacteria bacterium CG10_big_fil_rev_8_21_14_0_10_47_10 TaxID=1974652 RepID=A0A2H0TP84_9BACT|nr:MAG: hypothetical protein COU35_04900 [Candidatus Magasanikbacteria bacterium CG10_big_fil_rev_8_21_14_0_10_47_10]